MSNSFTLLESLLLRKGKVYFLCEHIRRLEKSSKHFKFKYSNDKILNAIKQIVKSSDDKKIYKLRLELSKDASFKLEKQELPSFKKEGEIGIALIPKSVNNDFLQHKTNHRAFYNHHYQIAKEKGFLDIIFYNENGELSEGCIHNLFLKKGSSYITPPASSGLLRGVYRNKLIENFPFCQEKKLYLKDLKKTDKIFLCNSVRSILKVNSFQML